jgi:hypothetical protein
MISFRALRTCRPGPPLVSGIPIIHVQVGFRSGLPEISSRNSLVAAVKKNPQRQQLFERPAGAIHSAFAPKGDDVVITKHRISAFTGKDLDMILRAKEIDTLNLMGSQPSWPRPMPITAWWSSKTAARTRMPRSTPASRVRCLRAWRRSSPPQTWPQLRRPHEFPKSKTPETFWVSGVFRVPHSSSGRTPIQHDLTMNLQ